MPGFGTTVAWRATQVGPLDGEVPTRTDRGKVFKRLPDEQSGPLTGEIFRSDGRGSEEIRSWPGVMPALCMGGEEASGP